MQKEQAERNVKLFYWYEAFSDPLFWGPIIILYVQKIGGMSLAEVYFMESICVFALIVLEIPSGALADLIGRKKTVFFGVATIFSALIIFSFGHGRLAVWLCNILFFAGYTFVSGADDALLFDSLKFLGRENKFRQIRGKASAYRLWLVAFSALGVGYLAKINIRLPIMLSIVPIFFDLIIVSRFVEPPFAGSERYDMKKHLAITVKSLSVFCHNSKVKWIAGFFVLLSVTSKLWFFTYNPYFECVGLELNRFGQIFFCLNLVAAVTSYKADYLAKKFGDRTSIVFLILFLSLPILIMGLYPIKQMAMLVLAQNVVRGYMNPFTDQILHTHLESQNRATVVSIRSAFSGLAQAVCLSLFGFLLSGYSLFHSMQILGVLCFLGGAVLFFFYGRVFPG